MNKRNVFITSALAFAGILAICVWLPLVMMSFMTEGRMPYESAALSIRDDALEYARKCEAARDTPVDLPDSIVRLKPLLTEGLDSGILIVFRRHFVEDYGYCYCHEDAGVPEGIADFCKEVSRGVCRYYNPG